MKGVALVCSRRARACDDVPPHEDGEAPKRPHPKTIKNCGAEPHKKRGTAMLQQFVQKDNVQTYNTSMWWSLFSNYFNTPEAQF